MTTKIERAASSGPEAELKNVANQFVSARRNCRALEDFPGDIPGDLETAYRIQDFAIEDWHDRIGGWKVGRIPPALEGKFGIDRLGGPIFATTIVHSDDGSELDMPVFVDGFAAIEAEYVAVIGSDAPADKTDWSTDEAAAIVADLRIGLEIASSPLATINELGPPVVISDFGNNKGLIVGPSIRDWRSRSLETMRCTSRIDGDEVGSGGAFTLTGGFVRSVQFLLELAARRGYPVKKGDLIATGQTTGIHDVIAGQTCVLDFGTDGRLACRLVPAAAA